MCQPHGQSFFPYKTCPQMHFLGAQNLKFFMRLQSPTMKRRGGGGGQSPSYTTSTNTCVTIIEAPYDLVGCWLRNVFLLLQIFWGTLSRVTYNYESLGSQLCNKIQILLCCPHTFSTEEVGRICIFIYYGRFIFCDHVLNSHDHSV